MAVTERWTSRIERTRIDATTKRLAREVMTSATWLDRVLQDEDQPEDQAALQDYLRHVLLRLEESSAAGRFLR